MLLQRVAVQQMSQEVRLQERLLQLMELEFPLPQEEQPEELVEVEVVVVEDFLELAQLHQTQGLPGPMAETAP